MRVAEGDAIDRHIPVVGNGVRISDDVADVAERIVISRLQSGELWSERNDGERAGRLIVATSRHVAVAVITRTRGDRKIERPIDRRSA